MTWLGLLKQGENDIKILLLISIVQFDGKKLN